MVAQRDKLLEEIAALIDHGQDLKFVVPQDTGFLRLDPDLMTKILALLERTTTLMREVTISFEDDPPAKAVGATLSPQEVADLAFVCRSELVEIHQGLKHTVNMKNAWKIAAQGDRAVARTIRALIPIEAALREYLGHAPLNRSWFDLDDALAIRGKFIEFWLFTKKTGTPDGPNQSRAFESLRDRIADLRQDPIYPYLRIDDKLTIRSLQKRVLSFLEATGSDTEESGRRLWQDLIGFFDLLMHINRREELQNHDRQLVGRVNRDLFHLTDATEIMPPAIHEQLKSLASLDSELDTLLLRDRPARSIEYREPIRRLHERMM